MTSLTPAGHSSISLRGKQDLADQKAADSVERRNFTAAWCLATTTVSQKTIFLLFLSPASRCPPEGPTQTPRPAKHYRVTPNQLQPSDIAKPARPDAEGRTLASPGLSGQAVFSLQLWAQIQQCFGVLKSDWEISVQSFPFLDV